MNFVKCSNLFHLIGILFNKASPQENTRLEINSLIKIFQKKLKIKYPSEENKLNTMSVETLKICVLNFSNSSI